MHLNFQKCFTQTYLTALKSRDYFTTMNNVLQWGVSADWSKKSLREQIICEEELKLMSKFLLLLATEAGPIYLLITYLCKTSPEGFKRQQSRGLPTGLQKILFKRKVTNAETGRS